MNLLKECEGAEKIGITGHIRPDGDCVGGCLALFLYLRKCLPQAQVRVFLEKPAEIFREIRGFDDITILPSQAQAAGGSVAAASDQEVSGPERYDVFFVLDSVPDRVGGALKYYEAAVRKVNIDHHVSNPGWGDAHLVRPGMGSVCEVLYELMEPERLDQDIAMALYIGMIHDTGVFQYSNTTPDTLKKAAHLIGFGFDFPRLIQETFYQKSWLQTQLLGKVLSESRLLLDGQCAVGMMDRKTMDELQAHPTDLEGIVNQLRNVKGVHCAIFMHEYETGVYKVSLRSDEQVDVAEVAVGFGGGGHVRAAGCSVKGEPDRILEQIVRRIEEQLNDNGE